MMTREKLSAKTDAAVKEGFRELMKVLEASAAESGFVMPLSPQLQTLMKSTFTCAFVDGARFGFDLAAKEMLSK